MPQQLHPGFGWCMSGLLQVTGEAATDQIIPFMSAAAASGDNVVQCYVLRFPTTVLTGVFVPVKDLETSEPLLQAGAFYELS